MAVIRRFVRQLGLWTLALAGFLVFTGWGGVDAPWSLGGRVPGVVAFALTLACFPAGIRVGQEVFDDREGAWADLGRLALVVLGVAALVTTLHQAVVPRALVSGRTAPAAAGPEVREMTLTELRDHLRTLAPAVRDLEPGVGSASAWRAYNVAAFEHDRRLAHASLPPLLAWIGLTLGFWISRIPVAGARVPTALLVAVGLLASIYLGGENGFEMVATGVAGPGAFAAWFIPLGPAILACGLGLPTLVALLAPVGADRV